MESIGQKLISARDSLGFSIEHIARETNIAKSYLIALESEDFEVFPGETYLLGFLRNYSEYLNLDPTEMINLYKNMQIQEQPAPMQELLDTRKKGPGLLFIIIILVLVLILAGVGYFYIYPNYKTDGEVRTEVKAEHEDNQKEPEPAKTGKLNVKNTYEFSDEVLEKRFKAGDAVIVKEKDKNYQLFIAEISDKVKFIHPRGEFEMKDGEEAVVDLDGDSSADIRVLLRSSNKDAGSLILHVDRFVQSSGSAMTDSSNVIPEAEGSEAYESAVDATSDDTGRPGAPSRAVAEIVIRDGSSPESFTLNIIFRGYCLFRYETKDGTREERYFRKGETFRLDADSSVRIWASNAGALAAKVNGVDISLGGSGEVSSRIIKWIYNKENSKYELKLIPVY